MMQAMDARRARADRGARHPQRAADLDRAHGHDQPLCRQRVVGIEPVFAYAYTRKVLQPDGTRTEEEVVDYAVQMWRDLFGDADAARPFRQRPDLAPLDHVRMQAAAQKWVDSSISKTINVPEDIGFEAFKDVYMRGLRHRLQGLHDLPAERRDGQSS
jgi:ribonucleotide reductase alpha subunit